MGGPKLGWDGNNGESKLCSEEANVDWWCTPDSSDKKLAGDDSEENCSGRGGNSTEEGLEVGVSEIMVVEFSGIAESSSLLLMSSSIASIGKVGRGMGIGSGIGGNKGVAELLNGEVRVLEPE